MPLIVKKYVNQTENTPASGKTYGRVAYVETLDMGALFNHMAAHGCVYTTGTILGVIEEMRKCILELTMDSKRAKLDGLGTFYISVESTGETDPDDFTSSNLVRAALQFTADQTNEYAMNSKELRQKVTIKGLDSLVGNPSDGNGGTTTNP